MLQMFARLSWLQSCHSILIIFSNVTCRSRAFEWALTSHDFDVSQAQVLHVMANTYFEKVSIFRIQHKRTLNADGGRLDTFYIWVWMQMWMPFIPRSGEECGRSNRQCEDIPLDKVLFQVSQTVYSHVLLFDFVCVCYFFLNVTTVQGLKYIVPWNRTSTIQSLESFLTNFKS